MSATSINAKPKGFDHLASFYDAFTCLISLNYINKSQNTFISELHSNKKGLILGGGTGYFLQKLLEQNQHIEITYVDFSMKMIEYAKKRISKTNPNDLHRVTFICKAVELIEFNEYDLIVCNYFLDMFDSKYVTILSKKMRKSLVTGGYLYVTDFTIPQKNIFFQWGTQTGLKLLYYFFNCTTQLKANKLPEINTILQHEGFTFTHTKDFLHGILRCRLYKKNSNY